MPQLNVGTLPVILAGPVVRRLTKSSVSAWLALSRPDPVTLQVTPPDDDPLLSPEHRGNAPPVRLEPLVDHGHRSRAPGVNLPPVYSYHLTSDGWPEQAKPDWTRFSLGRPQPTVPDAAHRPRQPGVAAHVGPQPARERS